MHGWRTCHGKYEKKDGEDERDEKIGVSLSLPSPIVTDALGRRWRLHSPLSMVTVILQNSLSLLDVSPDAPGFAKPFSFRRGRRTLRSFLRLYTFVFFSSQIVTLSTKTRCRFFESSHSWV